MYVILRITLRPIIDKSFQTQFRTSRYSKQCHGTRLYHHLPIRQSQQLSHTSRETNVGCRQGRSTHHKPCRHCPGAVLTRNRGRVFLLALLPFSPDLLCSGVLFCRGCWFCIPLYFKGNWAELIPIFEFFSIPYVLLFFRFALSRTG